MKKLYSLLFFLITLCFHLQSQANEVTIKGVVKYANGTRAANITVKVFVETPCVVEHTVVTNNDGYFLDKASCEHAITKVRLTISCGGQNIVQYKEVSSTNVVEASFTMCTEATSCAAKFNFEQVKPTDAQKFPVKFNSIGSEVKDGDRIVERKWSFGDGETNNTSIDLTHNYLKPGIYNVCLAIKTANGCSSSKCQNVEIKNNCTAYFTYEHTSAGFKFNSSLSSGSTNDPIKGRTWNFGDGSPVVQGNIDPVHTFAHEGTYNVCLVIWTQNGCENKICKQVVVQAPHEVTCASRFSFERIAPKKFRFNSNLSKVADGDHIVERQWEFRDGTPVVKTNDASILHEFSKAGLYEVCLRIKTAKGCESRFCLPVKVEDHYNSTEPAIKIITLYPAPFKNELKAVIFSRQNNLMATISIVDVYGQVKMTKQVFLVQGNNPFELSTESLLPGPYFFRIVTAYGTQSKAVYKM